jgi:hypothetical protein
MKNWLRKLILGWLGIADHGERLKDVERHFVTKRDAEGAPIETLADVPVDKRDDLRKPRTAGMSWKQRRAYLEATDGGTRAALPSSLPSTS